MVLTNANPVADPGISSLKQSLTPNNSMPECLCIGDQVKLGAYEGEGIIVPESVYLEAHGT